LWELIGVLGLNARGLVEGFRCDGGNAEERDGGRKGMWKRKGRKIS
jgi:hypothetical protein